MGKVTPFPARPASKRKPTGCRVAFDFGRWFVDLVDEIGRPWPRLIRRYPHGSEAEARRAVREYASMVGLKILPDLMPPPSIEFEVIDDEGAA